MHFRTYQKVIVLLILALLLSSTPAIDLHAEEIGGSTVASPNEEFVIYIPVINKQRIPVRADLPFGVQMYGDTGKGSKYYEKMSKLAAGWVRSNISWEQIERTNTTPNNYKWTNADKTVGAARDAGKHMILTLEHSPKWASSAKDGPIDKVPVSELAEFMAAVVERYDGDGTDDAAGSPVVNHFEIYNEPDHQGRWGNAGKEYAEMLKVVYPAMKAANPNVKVIFGGIAYDWFVDNTGSVFPPGPFVRSFTADVLANGGGDYFDVMAFHGYIAFARNWTDGQGTGFVEKTASLRGVMQKYGVNKPIMITETGIHSNADVGNPRTLSEQASGVVELYVQAMVADIDVLVWFMLYEPGGGYPFKNGLVTDDATPVEKPSYATYQVAAKELSSAQFERTLSVSETGAGDMEVHQFADVAKGRTLYVAWTNPIKSGATRQLKLPGASATVIDMYGNSSSVAGSGGKVTVNVGKEPIYIAVPR